MSENRKYLPTISELIDRLSIIQLKEVFITEHKEEYAKEIQDIVHDLNELMNWEKPTGDMIRAIIVLAQMNLHIWHNETKYRAGEGDGNLGLTHGLNGIRNTFLKYFDRSSFLKSLPIKYLFSVNPYFRLFNKFFEVKSVTVSFKKL